MEIDNDGFLSGSGEDDHRFFVFRILFPVRYEGGNVDVITWTRSETPLLSALKKDEDRMPGDNVDARL